MEKIILVADCGSTSCEWRLIEKGEVVELPSTAGFNPTYEPVAHLGSAIDGIREWQRPTGRISHVYYYGAGCASSESAQRVQTLLQTKFYGAVTEVHSDIWGAARAVHTDSPVICGILGTGSNACRFDGANIEFVTPSLGFILGDEGSGNHIGRLLLRGYFYRTMPVELRDAFESLYDLHLSNVLQKVYRQPNASGTLAQYAPFAKEKLDHGFIRDLVGESMRHFLIHFVCAFPDCEKIRFGAVGSVAFHFREVLQSEAKKLKISMGPILQRPIAKLTEYHLQNY